VAEILQGDIYFHPTDPKSVRGAQGRKKPLDRIKLPYRNPESAVRLVAAARAQALESKPILRQMGWLRIAARKRAPFPVFLGKGEHA
jgi:hypothetical protein